MQEKRLSALVIDSDPDARSLVSEALQSFGGKIQVVESEDTMAALSKFRLQKFDLVILDVNLPKQDGTAVLQHIKNLPPTSAPQVVVFTDRPKSNTWTVLVPQHKYQKKPCEFKDIRKTLAPLIVVDDPRSKKVTEKYLLAMTEATEKVFALTASIDLSRGDTLTRIVDDCTGDVSVSVEFQAPDADGSLALVFPTSTYKYILECMFGEKYDAVPKELLDASAELCEQILGTTRAKSKLGKFKTKPPLAKVHSEPNHSPKHLKRSVVQVRQMKCDGGIFYIEAALAAT